MNDIEENKNNDQTTSTEETIEEIAKERFANEFSRQLYKALIEAFDKLGGDPDNAINAAKGTNLVDWVSIQKKQVATSGLVANLVPGAHLAAMIIDMGFLLHKMAYTCWGIGAILDCKVLGKADFNQILQVWTDTQVKALEYAAVSKSVYALCEEAITTKQIWDQVKTSTSSDKIRLEDIDNSDKLKLCNEIYKMYESAEKISDELKVVGTNKDSLSDRERAKIIAKNVVFSKTLSTTAARSLAGKIATKTTVKLSSKLAIKLVGKMGAKLAAKAASGFVPFLGGVVGGGINYFFIDGIAKSAEEYYRHALKI